MSVIVTLLSDQRHEEALRIDNNGAAPGGPASESEVLRLVDSDSDSAIQPWDNGAVDFASRHVTFRQVTTSGHVTIFGHVMQSTLPSD
eukprot:CAMPEP_0196662290 /NCGR_PEP_ID=MMETSP1086-20130531/48028_1 /TAXON_ID=77921 /ORGANISM="Cyanoptyche  gloeocystis , Strain SAG4.97" /LENGTH=87 /DNA_ID=CAMNT_0041997573 /DNA_START=108 /DNA_END=369 /DNA_ORIENTATION=+